MKFIVLWSILIPFMALYLSYKWAHSSDLGYALPFIFFFFCACVALLVGFVGILTQNLRQNFFGGVLGLLFSMSGFYLYNQFVVVFNFNETSNIRQEVQSFLADIHRGNDVEIKMALKNFKSLSLPQVICTLASGEHGGNYIYIADDPLRDKSSVYPLQVLDIFKIAELALELNPSLPERNAIFFTLMTAIVDRGEIQSLKIWLELWDKYQSQTRTNFIRIAEPYSPADPSCPWGNSNLLIQEPVNLWGEAAIEIWLESGHSFIDDQQDVALNVIQTKAILLKFIASGVELRAHQNILTQKSQRFYQIINSDPKRALDLVDALIKNGWEPKNTNACQLFSDTISFVNNDIQKRNAFAHIKEKLCR